MKKILFLFLIIFLILPISFADSSLEDALNTTDTNIVLNEDTYFKSNADAVKISRDVNITGQGIDRTIIDGCQTQILSIKNFNVVISNLTFMNADFDSFGGAIANEGKLTLQNVRFVNNTAYNCGAIDNTGKLKVINCEFIDNSAYGRDAGALSNIGEATIENSTFISNIAYRNAGAIKSQGEKLTVRNSVFIANKAVGDDSYGGAFYTWASKSIIENCVFIDNYAANFGGAIFSYGGQANWCELSVTGSYFSNNSAGDLGGIYASRSSFIMNYSKILDTPTSLIHNYEEDINYNWWGENNPDWDSVLTDSSYEPDVYAVLDLKNESNHFYVDLYWNGTSENALISNMTGSIAVVNGSVLESNFTLKKGKYDFVVLNATDDMIVNVTVDKQLLTNAVDPIKESVLTASNVTMYYHDGTRYRVVLTDVDGNPLSDEKLTIILNDVEYSRKTDANGSASLALNLDSGKYLAQVIFNSTDYKPSYLENEIVIKPTIVANDVVKVFRNNTQYYAAAYGFDGKPLADGEMLTFNINGVMYNRKVTNGVARLNLNLEQGNYILTALNPVTRESVASNITILPKIAQNKDVVKYYRNATQYWVLLIGDDGNPVGAGENVTFNINGVFYTRQTNATGWAKLNLNLQTGDYIITAEYGGCRVANNITIKSVLSASDISMSYRDGTQFKATLLDGQGKLFSGQNIVFNVNGVFYTRQTDNNGVAKLNINLQPGKYIITSTYDELNIANTITIS
ncbi:hypothetical protein [Methanobrevibacter sp.]|uniref:hypothetical protein n=1 Tax=Methanobrevibacter sp. TaxID=66852 RepID=UPI00388E47F9